MKTKKFEKKLKLNKFTVATLTSYEMKFFKGGLSQCPSYTMDAGCTEEDCKKFNRDDGGGGGDGLGTWW
jgi:natural product precursor